MGNGQNGIRTGSNPVSAPAKYPALDEEDFREIWDQLQ
jgi:hypothetical protein